MNVRKTLIPLFFLIMPLSVIAADQGDATGKQLYQLYCSQCHGIEGDGFGVNSYDMDIAPRDHTDTGEMAARTDEDFFKVIKFGGKAIDKSVLMPDWGGNMSDEEINLVVIYLREICCAESE